MAEVIDVDTEGTGSTARLAAEVLEAGGLAVIPTDTVYGLAASVHYPEALRRIFSVKGRQSEKSLVVMVATLEEAEELVDEGARHHLRRLAMFWPGKLTIVARRNPTPWMEEAAPGRDSLGLRVPDHTLALSILEKAGPLAVTSANRSGEDAPAVYSKISPRILEMADVACFSRHPGDGIPSTVVEVGEDRIKILRPGGISLPDLEKAWRGRSED